MPHFSSFVRLSVPILRENYKLLPTATTLKRLITGAGKRPSDNRRCFRNWLSHKINILTICCMITLMTILIFLDSLWIGPPWMICIGALNKKWKFCTFGSFFKSCGSRNLTSGKNEQLNGCSTDQFIPYLTDPIITETICPKCGLDICSSLASIYGLQIRTYPFMFLLVYMYPNQTWPW